MNEHYRPLSALSLRSKLVLSYLFVIIGTVLVLSYAVSSAAEQYFISVQQEGLRDNVAQFEKLSFECLINNKCNPRIIANDGVLFLVTDVRDTTALCLEPPSSQNSCGQASVHQILQETINSRNYQMGTLTVSIGNTAINSVYLSKPLIIEDSQGQRLVVGAMFISQALLSDEFVEKTNQANLLAGLVIAALALLCSILLVRRFTHPLKVLTAVAERMKRGEFTQRVPVPKTLDELGLLGLTFNEMADTIEADINELRRQDQVRRDLVANIAHDLATPLTAVQGFSEALADNVITDQAQRLETAQRIGREVQRMRRLVADIQHVSSLESGHVRLDLAELDMHTLVDETVSVIMPECEQQGIAIYNDISPQIPVVMADSDRITQILLNLVDNARRHTPTGGQIHIGSILQNNYVYLWVSDTGKGISADDLPHIFERFYRADRSRTAATGGNGLGLSIVKAIITAHGGNIWAESTPGKGTRITFTLPVVVQEQTQKQKKQTADNLAQSQLASRDGTTQPYPPHTLPPMIQR